MCNYAWKQLYNAAAKHRLETRHIKVNRSNTRDIRTGPEVKDIHSFIPTKNLLAPLHGYLLRTPDSTCAEKYSLLKI